jgi:hypothetical protein
VRIEHRAVEPERLHSSLDLGDRAGDVLRREGEQAGEAVGIEAAGLGQTIVRQRGELVPMRGSSICTPGAVSSNIWRSMPRSSIRAIRSGPISHNSCCSCASAAKFPAMRSELSSGGQGERSRASWASRISGMLHASSVAIRL